MSNHPNRSRVKSPASNQIENRGGKRDGAGAPTHSELGEKIMRSYRLAPDVIAILDANRPAGPMIEKLVREQCGKWPEGKWHWMMEYCKRNLLHPGEEANWKQAEKAYEERKELPETPL